MSTSRPEPASASSAPSPEPASPAGDTARSAAPDDGAPVARVLDVADPSRMRRAPLYGRFGFVGFLVGAALALALVFLPVGDSEISPGSLFLLLLIPLGTAGVLGGLLWALVADRRSLRRRGRE